MTSQTKPNHFLTYFLIFFPSTFLLSQKLDEYHHQQPQNVLENISKSENNFNGYTNYWHDVYKNSYRYGNLYKMEVVDVEKTLLQSKIDIAEDFGLPGLIMQEGFLKQLFSADYAVLDNPSLNKLNETLDGNKNIVAFVDSQSEVGQELSQKITQEIDLVKKLNSHQFNAKDFVQIRAFYLEKGDSKLFIVSSKDKTARNIFKQLLENTKNVISKYDMHKGWFGAYTLLNSVTITKGHPLEVIGTGMNEGNSWFVFDGYMDYLSKNQMQDWIKKVDLPIVTDVGAGNVFGASNYDGFQIQQMFDTESWVKFAKEKKGYVFRKVWDTVADPYKYDGYFATEGNKEQIDNEDVPFVLKTGQLDKGALSSMVLFIEKDEALTNKSMWKAIMNRREVGVLEKGQMIGPAEYRNTLQMLLLDRVYLEEYFGDPININAEAKGYDLKVVVTNTSGTKMAGNLEIGLPPEMQIKGDSVIKMELAPKVTKTISFKLRPTASAMDNTNPIAVHFKHKNGKKSTLTMLDLPPTISVHRLLYAHAPLVEYR